VRRKRDDEGASAVELALVMPVLLLILFGIIEFGLAFSRNIAITNAAHEGARVVSLDGADAEETVRRTSGFAEDEQDDIAVTVDSDCDGSGVDAQVSVHYEHEFTVLGGLAFFGIDHVDLEATAVEKCV
jgi:Flp pilus assembly protein TadG